MPFTATSSFDFVSVKHCDKIESELSFYLSVLHHSTHTAHAGSWIYRFFCFFISNDSFSCKNCRSYTICIKDSTLSNLSWVNDTFLNHINIFFSKSIETMTNFAILNLIYDYSTFKTCISSNLTKWSFKSL